MKRRKERSDEDGRCYLPTQEEIAIAAKAIREANQRGEGRRVYKVRDAELRQLKIPPTDNATFITEYPNQS